MAATEGLGPDSSSWQKASFARSSSAPPDANWLMSNPALRDPNFLQSVLGSARLYAATFTAAHRDECEHDGV